VAAKRDDQPTRPEAVRRLVEFGRKGEEMIRLRFAVLATLVAAAFAGCLTYFVMPLARVDTDQRLPATMPTLTAEISSMRLNGISKCSLIGTSMFCATVSELNKAPS